MARRGPAGQGKARLEVLNKGDKYALTSIRQQSAPRAREEALMAKVISCTNEVATFDDKSMVVRQRPTLNATFGIQQIMQPDNFRRIFKVGCTADECKARLANPELFESVG